jgi:excisionase family DNA binding protein
MPGGWNRDAPRFLELLKTIRTRLVHAGDVGERLKVSERTVRNWVSSGQLLSYKIGSSRRFDPADIDAFLSGFRQEGGES